MLTGEERKESIIDSWDEEFYDDQSNIKGMERKRNSIEIRNSLREYKIDKNVKTSIYREPLNEELKKE